MGDVVAVTGDGVGDSPALKAADIGISLGSFATDTALEAADVVLFNDEIASIVDGIEESRKALSNIKKAVCYALSSQIGLVLPFIVMVVFQIPCFTCPLVLYVLIAVDFIPNICLMLEPAEIGIMTWRGRRNK
jgi:P-type E1-E2 ATPase